MLRNRHFLFLWFVNIATTLAIELFTVTILVTIYEQTASTLLAAGTMVARTLPAFLLGPVAGVLVDRFPRKNMLISMDLVRLVLVVIAILFLLGNEKVQVVGIYLILASLSVADVFHRPARLYLSVKPPQNPSICICSLPITTSSSTFLSYPKGRSRLPVALSIMS